MNQEQMMVTRTVSSMNKQLVSTGIKDELRKEFKKKLEDIGWRKAMEEKCRMYIREKDLNNVSVEELLKHLQDDSASDNIELQQKRIHVTKEVSSKICNLVASQTSMQ